MIFKISLLFIPLISPRGLFYKIANFYCFKKFLCLYFIYVQIQVCTDGGKREIWGSHFSPSTMWVLQNGLRSLGLAAGNSIHKTISKGLQFSILNLGFLNYQVSNFRLFLNIRRYMFIQFWGNTENGTFFWGWVWSSPGWAWFRVLSHSFTSSVLTILHGPLLLANWDFYWWILSLHSRYCICFNHLGGLKNSMWDMLVNV